MRITNKLRLIATTSLTLTLAALAVQPAMAQDALPTGGSVVAGSATIGGQTGGSQTVTQTSNRAVIDWASFNVGQGNTLTFVQPNADGATLNRVTGATTSTIAGQITANGSVYLINPNGIQITKSGAVSAGRGFVASTLDISNAEFMAGAGQFTGTGGLIDHQGSITVGTGGVVGLLGGGVFSSGLIVAPAGKVVIGAVTHATLDLNGGGFLQVSLPDDATLAGDGAAALLSAQATYDATRNVVNLDGLSATSVAGSNGAVILTGKISVDSTGGDAGSILVMGDNTRASGELSARATGASGNGGLIETSGNFVDFTGLRVDTQAAHGATGTWLIDPTDLTIDAAAATTIQNNLNFSNVTLATSSSGATSGPGNASPGAGDIIIIAAINWSANTLTLNAANSIKVNAVLTASGGGLALNYGDTMGSTSATPSAGSGLDFGLTSAGFTGRIDFTGSGNSLSVNGDAYTIITSLGVAGSTTGTDLQGINGDLTGRYALGADIDAIDTSGWNSGAGFDPLGATDKTGGGAGFTGSFLGLGHTISDLTINRSSAAYAGLFGYTGAGASIAHVGLVNAKVSANGGVGGVGGTAGALVGVSDGAITQSFATGSVSANGGVGGPGGGGDGAAGAGGTTGGLIGVASGGTIETSYWDRYASGQASSVGSNTGSVNVATLLALTSDPTQSAATDYIYKASAWSMFAAGGTSDIDTVGGQALTWRMYDGFTTPMLKAFLRSGTVAVSTGNATLTYNGDVQQATSTITVPGGVDASKILGFGRGRDAGGYAMGAYSTQQGYDLIVTAGTLTITPKALTVTYTANTASSIYGDAPGGLGGGYLVTGLIGDDTLSGSASWTTTATATSGVGAYAINGSGLTASGNYTLSASQAAGNATALTITPRALTVTGNSGSVVYTGAAQTNGFTTSGLVGSDTVTTVDGLASRTNVGISADSLSNATGSGLSNYTITYANGGLTITPKALTVTGSTTSAVYTGSSQTNGFTTSGLVGSDTVTTVDGLASRTNVGSSADSLSNATGSGLSNYTITYANGGLTITPKALTVTGSTTSAVYTGSAQTNGFTTSGLVGSDTVTAVNGLGGGTNAGTYADDLSGATGSGLSNYTITYANGTLTITPKALTVTYTANTASSIYGDAPGGLGGGYLVTGLIGDDTLSGSASWTTTATATSGVGAYAINGSGLTASGNYTLSASQAAGNATALTITPRAITVTADSASRAYGASNPPLTWTVGGLGLVNGDALSGALATLADEASATGDYAITRGALTATPNYAMTFVDGTLSVTPVAAAQSPSRVVAVSAAQPPKIVSTGRDITPSLVEVSFSGTNGAGAASNGASQDGGGGACQAKGDKAGANCAGQSGS